jgi:hypothetical protein
MIRGNRGRIRARRGGLPRALSRSSPTLPKSAFITVAAAPIPGPTDQYAKLTHVSSDETATLIFKNEWRTLCCLGQGEWSMDVGKRSALLRKLDEDCPYQVVLPRRQLTDDSSILDFLLANVGWFDMYIEDDHAEYVRYCFEAPLDAELFRARFEPKAERAKFAG